MYLRIFGVFVSLFCFLAAPGCSGKGGTGGPAAHLKRAQAKGLFPSVLGSFAQGEFKVQPEDEQCVLYKSDYLRGQKSVKVVVNDCLPADPEWDDLMQDGDGDLAGFPSALSKDGKTVTLMVRVGDRFRVDFKTKTLGTEALKEAAEGFSWPKLKSLAGL